MQNNKFEPKKKVFKVIFASIICLVSCIADSYSNNKTFISNVGKPVSFYVGRQNDLKDISNYFSSGKNIVSIVGITGIGKTELLKQYVYQAHKNYNIIWLFDCNIDLNTQFYSLLKEINNKICLNGKYCNLKMDIESSREQVLDYLKEHPKTLLIFDNLKIGENDKIKNIIQNINYGYVLIGSQDKLGLPNIIALKNFERGDSTDLIKKTLNVTIDNSIIDNIASIFDDYPIMIVKGINFINNNQAIGNNDLLYFLKAEKFANIQSLIHYINEKILNEDERTLLKKMALVNNHDFSSDFAFNILYDSDKNPNYEEFISLIQKLIRFRLIEFRSERVTNNTRFEMHDLIRNTMMDIQNKNVMKDDLEAIIKKINNKFPEDVSSYNVLTERDPTFQNNLELILENAEHFDISLNLITELRKNLLIVYFHKFDYYHCKAMVNWFDEKEKEQAFDLNKMDEKDLATYTWFRIYRGMYSDFVIGDYKSAIKNFNIAKTLIKRIKGNESLKFTVYSQLAQTLAYKGDLEIARENIELAHEIYNISKKKLDLGLLWFVKAKISLEQGLYDQALLDIQNGIDFESDLPQNQFTAPSYMLKAEILCRKGDFKSAEPLIFDIFDKMQGYFKEDHELKAKTLLLLGTLEIHNNNISDAKKHILQAREIFNSIEERKNENLEFSKDEDLALTYLFEGDIYTKKNFYDKACEAYQIANTIFDNIYSENKSVDRLRELYDKIIFAAKHSKNDIIYKQFYFKRYDVFGEKIPK